MSGDGERAGLGGVPAVPEPDPPASAPTPLERLRASWRGWSTEFGWFRDKLAGKPVYIALDGRDFGELVAGRVVRAPGAEIILSDIGFGEMIARITEAELVAEARGPTKPE
jgi:hypothetical protein